MTFLDIHICFCFLLSSFGKYLEDVIFSQTQSDFSVLTPGQPMLCLCISAVPCHRSERVRVNSREDGIHSLHLRNNEKAVRIG